ncbi:myosin heavy chain non-muscle [Anaeramoeba ignava]|uniref:Myosin heavy chain non-muscle n=1 Tax=Anaeramoeba ignava TaxID=1746090 RepID=A0A9Q0LM02_ANAIG|nr:myosin heavy chain non-muscle [Anaeramoeba ignava]
MNPQNLSKLLNVSENIEKAQNNLFQGIDSLLIKSKNYLEFAKNNSQKNKNSQKEIAKISRKNEELQKEKEIYQEKIQQFEKQIQETDSNLKNSEDPNFLMQKTLLEKDKLQQENSFLQKQLKIIKMKNKQEKLQENTKELMDLNAKIDSLSQEKDNLKNQKEILESIIERFYQQNMSIRIEFNKLQKDLEILKMEKFKIDFFGKYEFESEEKKQVEISDLNLENKSFSQVCSEFLDQTIELNKKKLEIQKLQEIFWKFYRKLENKIVFLEEQKIQIEKLKESSQISNENLSKMVENSTKIKAENTELRQQLEHLKQETDILLSHNKELFESNLNGYKTNSDGNNQLTKIINENGIEKFEFTSLQELYAKFVEVSIQMKKFEEKKEEEIKNVERKLKEETQEEKNKLQKEIEILKQLSNQHLNIIQEQYEKLSKAGLIPKKTKFGEQNNNEFLKNELQNELLKFGINIDQLLEQDFDDKIYSKIDVNEKQLNPKKNDQISNEILLKNIFQLKKEKENLEKKYEESNKKMIEQEKIIKKQEKQIKKIQNQNHNQNQNQNQFDQTSEEIKLSKKAIDLLHQLLEAKKENQSLIKKGKITQKQIESQNSQLDLLRNKNVFLEKEVQDLNEKYKNQDEQKNIDEQKEFDEKEFDDGKLNEYRKRTLLTLLELKKFIAVISNDQFFDEKKTAKFITEKSSELETKIEEFSNLLISQLGFIDEKLVKLNDNFRQFIKKKEEEKIQMEKNQKEERLILFTKLIDSFNFLQNLKFFLLKSENIQIEKDLDIEKIFYCVKVSGIKLDDNSLEELKKLGNNFSNQEEKSIGTRKRFLSTNFTESLFDEKNRRIGKKNQNN